MTKGTQARLHGLDGQIKTGDFAHNGSQRHRAGEIELADVLELPRNSGNPAGNVAAHEANQQQLKRNDQDNDGSNVTIGFL